MVSKFNSHDRTEGNDEWLTPPELIKALGEFDLDPCSPIPEKRPWPTAKNHFSILDNGLQQPWFGRVWCNPPYGSKAKYWLAKCAEYKNVTALIFARTETQQFFNYIWTKATSVCFIKGRIAFYDITGKKRLSAGAPSVLITWNDINANILKDAVIQKKINGMFIRLRKLN